MHLPALVAYLSGLRENNNKAWFVMNKPAYDILRAEFVTLVADVIAGLTKVDPHVAAVDPKKALFRIYRDIRFSNDKTPYKTHLSAAIADRGVKHWGPMYYLHIDADGNLHLGAGCWMPPKDVLQRIRGRVVDDRARLARIVRARRFVETFGDLRTDDRLARLPKGYDALDPKVSEVADLLRLKSFVASTDVALMKRGNAAKAKDLPKTIVDVFAAAVPLNDWLRLTPVSG